MGDEKVNIVEAIDCPVDETMQKPRLTHSEVVKDKKMAIA